VTSTVPPRRTLVLRTVRVREECVIIRWSRLLLLDTLQTDLLVANEDTLCSMLSQDTRTLTTAVTHLALVDLRLSP
jgi:hypothetical protein